MKCEVRDIIRMCDDPGGPTRALYARDASWDAASALLVLRVTSRTGPRTFVSELCPPQPHCAFHQSRGDVIPALPCAQVAGHRTPQDEVGIMFASPLHLWFCVTFPGSAAAAHECFLSFCCSIPDTSTSLVTLQTFKRG